jgi:outer membrane lipoprotein-sorting protein
MKKSKFLLLSLFALTSFIGVQAQTVDEIINKHIEAIGGKEKISNIKTKYAESTMEVMGNEAPTTTYIIYGKGYKSETDFNGQKIIQCVTDKGGWGINPMMGQTSPEAISGDLVKSSQSQLQVGGPLLDYAAKGNKVELKGREDVNGVSAYKINLTTKDSIESTYYIDPTTYYILKTTGKVNANGQETETIVAFSDYRKTDFGNVEPFGQQITLPQITLNITTKKIEINKDIDPKIFDMPK